MFMWTFRVPIHSMARAGRQVGDTAMAVRAAAVRFALNLREAAGTTIPVLVVVIGDGARSGGTRVRRQIGSVRLIRAAK